MKHEKGVPEVLSAGALIVGLALSPQARQAQPQPDPGPISGVAFDSEGRIVALDLGLLQRLGVEPREDHTKLDFGLPAPVPVPGNKINAMCVC